MSEDLNSKYSLVDVVDDTETTEETKGNYNLIDVEDSTESVYSKGEDTDPVKPKVKQTEKGNVIDYEYYTSSDSQATVEEKDWFEKNKDNFRKRVNPLMEKEAKYEWNIIEEDKQEVQDLNNLQDVNPTPADPINMIEASYANPYAETIANVNILEKKSTDKNVNEGERYEAYEEASKIKFDQYKNVSGMTLGNSFVQKEKPHSELFKIFHSTNNNKAEISQGNFKEGDPTFSTSAPVVDKGTNDYVAEIYGLKNLGVMGNVTPSEYIYKFVGDGYEHTLYGKNSIYKKLANEEIDYKTFESIRDRIYKNIDNMLKYNLKAEFPKYMDQYQREIDVASDEVERVALENFQDNISVMPVVPSDLPKYEDGTVNYELAMEQQSIENIINQELGGGVESSESGTFQTREEGPEQWTIERGIDLSYLRAMQEVLTVKGDNEDKSLELLNMSGFGPKATEDLNELKKELSLDGYQGTDFNKRNVRRDIITEHIKNYINDRLDTRGILELDEYAMFYDPNTKRILRSNNEEDKVIIEQKGLKKVGPEDLTLTQLIELLANNDTDLDYKKPITVYNKINDLQFDVALLSNKILNSNINLSTSQKKIIEANASAGKIVESPKILSGSDPLISLYNDAVTKRKMLGMGFVLNADLTKIAQDGYGQGFLQGTFNIFNDGQSSSLDNYDSKRTSFYESLSETNPGILHSKENPDGFTVSEIEDLYDRSIGYKIGEGTPAFIQVIAEFAITRKLAGKSIKKIGSLVGSLIEGSPRLAKYPKLAKNIAKATTAFTDELITIEARNILAGTAYGAEPMSGLFAVAAPVGKMLNKFYKNMFTLSATSGRFKYGLLRKINMVPPSVQKFTGDFIFKPGTSALVMTVGEAPEAILSYIKTGNTEQLHHLIDPEQFLIKSAQIISTGGLAPIKNLKKAGEGFVRDIKNYRDNISFKKTLKEGKNFFNLGSEYENARNEKQRSKILNDAVNKKLQELGINPEFANAIKGSGLTHEQIEQAIKEGKGVDGLIEMAKDNFKKWESDPKSGTAFDKVDFSNPESIKNYKARANFEKALKALANAKESGMSVEELSNKYLKFSELSNFMNMNNMQINFLDAYQPTSNLFTEVKNMATSIKVGDNLSPTLTAGGMQTLRKLGNPILIRAVLESYGIKPKVIDQITGKVNEDGTWQPNGSLLSVAHNIAETAKKKKIDLNTKKGEEFEKLEIDKYLIDGQITTLKQDLKTTESEYEKNNIKNKIKELEEKRGVKDNRQVVVAEEAIEAQKVQSKESIEKAEAEAKAAGQPIKIANNANELKAFYKDLYDKGDISEGTYKSQVSQIDNPNLLKKGQTVTTRTGEEIVVYNLEDIFNSGGDKTTGPHELVHPWINSVVKRLGIRDKATSDAFVENFKEGLTENEQNIVVERLAKMGIKDLNSLEYFNAYAEAVNLGLIDPQVHMKTTANVLEKLIEGDSNMDVNFDENGFSPELGVSIREILNQFASEAVKDKKDKLLTEDLGVWNTSKGKDVTQEAKTQEDGSSAIDVPRIGKVNDQVEVKDSVEDIARRNKLLGTIKDLESRKEQALSEGNSKQAEALTKKIKTIKDNIEIAIKNRNAVSDILNNNNPEAARKTLYEANRGMITDFQKAFVLDHIMLDNVRYEDKLDMQLDFQQDVVLQFYAGIEAYMKGYEGMSKEDAAAPLFAYLDSYIRPKIPKMLYEASGGEYGMVKGESLENLNQSGESLGDGGSVTGGGSKNLKNAVKIEPVEIENKVEVTPVFEGKGFNFSDNSLKQFKTAISIFTTKQGNKASDLKSNIVSFAVDSIVKDLAFSPNKTNPDKQSFNKEKYEESVYNTYNEVSEFIEAEGPWLRLRNWDPFYNKILTDGGSLKRLGKDEIAQYESVLLDQSQFVDFMLYKGDFEVSKTKKDGTTKTPAEITRETTNKVSQRAIKLAELLGTIKVKSQLTEAVADQGSWIYSTAFAEGKKPGEIAEELGLYERIEDQVQDQVEMIEKNSGPVNFDRAVFEGNVVKKVNEEIISSFGTRADYEMYKAKALKSKDKNEFIVKVDGIPFSANDVINFTKEVIDSEYSKSVDASESSNSFEKEIVNNNKNYRPNNTFLKTRSIEEPNKWLDKVDKRLEVLNQRKNDNKEKAKYNYYNNKTVNLVKYKNEQAMMKKYAPYSFSLEQLKGTGLNASYMMAGEGYGETGHNNNSVKDSKGNTVVLEPSKYKNYNWGKNMVLNIDSKSMLSEGKQMKNANIMLSKYSTIEAKNKALSEITSPEDINNRKEILKSGWSGRFDFIWEEGISEAERLDRLEFLGGMSKRQSSGQTSGWRALASIIGGEFGNIDLLASEIKGGESGDRQLEHGIPMKKFTTTALSFIARGDKAGLMDWCNYLEGFFANNKLLKGVDDVIGKTPGGDQAVKGGEIQFISDGKGGIRQATGGEAGTFSIMDVVMIPDGAGGSSSIRNAIDSKVAEAGVENVNAVEVYNMVKKGTPGITPKEIKDAVEIISTQNKVNKPTKIKNNKFQDKAVVDQKEVVGNEAIKNSTSTSDQVNNAADIDAIVNSGGNKDMEFKHGDGSVSTYNSKTKVYTQPNKTNKINTDYKVVMLAGGAGSGKSTTSKALLNKLDITKDMAEVNVDIFKDDLKEQLGLPGKEAEFSDWQRSLNSRLFAIARKEKQLYQDDIVASGKGLVVDGTFASYNVNTKTCEALEAAGYEVTILHVKSSLEKASANNKARGEAGGRSIPKKALEKNYEDVDKTLAKVKLDGRVVIEADVENLKEGEVAPDVVQEMFNRFNGTVRSKILTPDEKVQDQVEPDTKSAADMIANKYTDVPKGDITESQADNIGKGKKKGFRIMPFSIRHAAPLLLETVGKGDKKSYELVTRLEETGNKAELKFNSYRAKVYDGMKQLNKITRKNKNLKLDKPVLEVKNKDGEVVANYTAEDAIRIYNWNEAGYKIPGLESTTIEAAKRYVENDLNAKQYANNLRDIINDGSVGYFEPYEGWSGNNLKQDIYLATESKRSGMFGDFEKMFNDMYTPENLNKIKAGMGPKKYKLWWESVLDYKDRSMTGRTTQANERIGGGVVNFLHGGTALALLGNTKSAITQLLSISNYFVADGMSLIEAGKSLGSASFFNNMRKILKSDYLKSRGSNYDLALKELTDLESRYKEGKDKALQLSFLLSSLGDRGAITFGGALMMTNRTKAIDELKIAQEAFDKSNSNLSQKEYDKAYADFEKKTIAKHGSWIVRYQDMVKKGFTEKEAEDMILEEISIYSEKTQQSIYSANLGYQQTKAIGKVTLNFMNTQIKYNNLVLEEAMKYTRGFSDKKSGAKAANYLMIQTSMFAFVSSGLQFALMDDEEEYPMVKGKDGEMVNQLDEVKAKKKEQMLWSMAYNLVDGTGLSGKAFTTVAKVIKEGYDTMTDEQKYSADYVRKVMDTSPSLSIKMGKIRGAKYDIQEIYKMYKKTGEITDDMLLPGLRAGSKIFSFATNFGGPEFAMALLDKQKVIMDERYTFYQHLAVALGWSPYSVDEDFYKKRNKEEMDGVIKATDNLPMSPRAPLGSGDKVIKKTPTGNQTYKKRKPLGAK